MAIDNTVLTAFQAASTEGMKVSTPHQGRWRLPEGLTSGGCRWGDLGGSRPNSTPATYLYKRGLGGRHGATVRQTETYESIPTAGTVCPSGWLNARAAGCGVFGPARVGPPPPEPTGIVAPLAAEFALGTDWGRPHTACAVVR
jgi:hypothetical protein